MRTTIEISEEMRNRLVALAAKRRLKGFSSLIEEALENYFREMDGRERKREKALALCGKLGDEADGLEDVMRELRDSWR